VSRPPVGAMVIVVPVRNEAELLEGCLAAVAAAVRAAEGEGLRCETRVVLDACTDGSRDIALASGFPIVECDAARVGIARALGAAAGMQAVDDVATERVWLANTDADSRVPAHWLLHQLQVARSADVYVGTVRPDFGDLPAIQRDHWLRTHPPGRANRNTHGANLGVRAQTYVDAGGFAPIGEHEDVDLVARCRARGAVIVGDAAAEVITSGRAVGRTPGGYAGFLRQQRSELLDGARGGTPASSL
jgi:glycosyltransferase involved in cell wall biosynthesis